MTTIHIQDDLHPVRTHDDLHSPGVAHGIYSMRTNTSFTGHANARKRGFSRPLPRTATGRSDVESDGGLQQESDYKQKQVSRVQNGVRGLEI